MCEAVCGFPIPPVQEIVSMSFFQDDTEVESCSATVLTNPCDTVRCVRPSVLDPCLPGEPSLAPCVCMPQVAVLYMHNRPVAIIQATSLDQAALDSWLACLRMRSPRTCPEL
jgi:hypothetical protein